MSQSLFVGFALAASITMGQITSAAGVTVAALDQELVYQPDLETTPAPTPAPQAPCPMDALCCRAAAGDRCQTMLQRPKRFGKCAVSSTNSWGMTCAFEPLIETTPAPTPVPRAPCPMDALCCNAAVGDPCQFWVAGVGVGIGMMGWESEWF